jgi:dihydrofolate reductase
VRKVLYSISMSLDGYINGPGGDLSWSVPDEELFRFHSDEVAELGLHVCGRRLYEAMLYWETVDQDPNATADEREFGRRWRALPKIVASTTLASPEGNYRLIRDDIAGQVAALKQQPGKDIAVGGAELAGTLIHAGLVDEFRLFVIPVVLGGGTPCFPAVERPIKSELIETRTFAGKVTYLRLRVVPAAA